MAATTAAQVSTLFNETGAQRTVLLRIIGVNTGDTIDVSTVGPVVFKKVEAAAFIGGNQLTAVAGSISGTVITLTSSGMINDTVSLLIIGLG
jgi:hypothetical protein